MIDLNYFLLNNVEGSWKVGDKNFSNKYQALIYATDTKQDVKFIYFDEVWNLFDRSLLGKIPLPTLYKERANQIRDSYDYLILYFSGGSDSYNVLRTFLDNNIKLDEVCVKWPMAAIRSKIYSPNTIDTSARNTLSEWDYAIVPVLNWLSQYHPDVKIQISDWTTDLSPQTYDEKIFTKVNNWNDVEIPFMISYSSSEELYLNKGKKVCSIYGIDKPILAYSDNKWFMAFTDTGTGMGIASDHNPNGTEYFYWSPKSPIVAMEQAFQLASFLDKNIHLKKYFYSDVSNNWSFDFKIHALQMQNNIARRVLYNTWNNNFQADKPVIADREDKHFWIFNHDELRMFRDSFLHMNDLFLSPLSDKFIETVVNSDLAIEKKRGRYKHMFSKWHFVKNYA